MRIARPSGVVRTIVSAILSASSVSPSVRTEMFCPAVRISPPGRSRLLRRMAAAIWAMDRR